MKKSSLMVLAALIAVLGGFEDARAHVHSYGSEYYYNPEWREETLIGGSNGNGEQSITLSAGKRYLKRASERYQLETYIMQDLSSSDRERVRKEIEHSSHFAHSFPSDVFSVSMGPEGNVFVHPRSGRVVHFIELYEKYVIPMDEEDFGRVNIGITIRDPRGAEKLLELRDQLKVTDFHLTADGEIRGKNVTQSNIHLLYDMLASSDVWGYGEVTGIERISEFPESVKAKIQGTNVSLKDIEMALLRVK